MKTRALQLFVLMVGVALLATGASASPTGQIHGCSKNKGGALRLLKDGASCKSSEAGLDWNIEGPSGPAGATGASGVTGPSGATGAAGGPAPGMIGGGTGWDHAVADDISLGVFGYSVCPAIYTCEDVVPVAGTLRNLYVTGYQDYDYAARFVVMKNGVDSAVECTIHAAVTCSDKTHSVTFAAGDGISVHVVSDPSGPSGVFGSKTEWAAEYGPPAE